MKSRRYLPLIQFAFAALMLGGTARMRDFSRPMPTAGARLTMAPQSRTLIAVGLAACALLYIARGIRHVRSGARS